MLKEIYHKYTETAQKIRESDFCKNAQCFQNLLMTKVNALGKYLAKNNVSAISVSIFGFIIGLMAINFLAMNMYFEALVCILINRFCDILDGAVAKFEGESEFGKFIDATLDFIFYGGVIFGFALADIQENATAACFLLFAFMSSATTMLAFGVVDKNAKELKKSPFYLGGLAQGFETLCALVLLCVMPFIFKMIAILLGCWCILKVLIIISGAYWKFNIAGKGKK
ncbi:MAG: CDP-alcohol phosphatidyltransferase family protein [Alphaproteobacteria bacterium]|nr:CDP-alcohol phosphatidyltransferase family protein [Alphaproteobacteria bacterium]